MSFKEANEKALQIAKQSLTNTDLSARISLLGFPKPQNNIVNIRAFAQDMLLSLSDLNIINARDKKPVKLGDHILILHYLQNDKIITLQNELISFKNLSGGQFYWQPFLSRTVKPLVSRIHNDLDLLKKNLDRFDWEPAELGDFSAKIHGIGSLYITLSYHKGDDEFPPDADVLFDKCIKHVFSTEDAAVLASRICLGLL